MQHGRMLAWLGGAAVLAAAVLALRQAQPVVDREQDQQGPLPSRPAQVQRFVADGVVLPEPARPPAEVSSIGVSRTGHDRVRVAWAEALPGGSPPDNAVGYDVAWRATDGAESGRRLVVVPEVELDGLRADGDYVVEVRAVNANGRRSAPTVSAMSPASATAAPATPDPRRFTGLAEPFDGPFSVDSSVLAARWHLSGYPGCTRAVTDGGMLSVDLACGADLAVLRSRAPMRLTGGASGSPTGAVERGRVMVVTDGAGPRSSLSIDLVPGPVDRVGIERRPVPAPPPGGTTAVDPALPDGTIRVVVDDAGVRVSTGPGVPRVPSVSVPVVAPTRGVGVLHTFEVVLDVDGVRVLQDGEPVAVAGVLPPWPEAHLLIGLGGPDGQQARVRVDAIGFTGPASMGPLTYTHPVVPATQRVLGTAEQAPGIGISRERLAGARSARLVATVRTATGVDLGGLVLQHGEAQSPARPAVASVPTAPGAEVTVVADLQPQVLGSDGPAAVSPLVLRAPGAESIVVPITDSYLDIVPLTERDLPTDDGRGQRMGQPPATALPRPALAVLDSNSNEVTTVPAGARVVVEVNVDGLAGQLGGVRLAGIAGFQLWLSGRLIAGVPTAVDGAGVGGVYRVAVSTGSLPPGRQSLELRLIASDPTISPASVLSSWHQS